jgi:rhodanese-related sulfurtransferase
MDTFPEISFDDLSKAIANKSVTLIDVNGTASFQDGHIPKAIDFEAQASNLASLLPKDKSALIVCYCGGPACTAYLRGAKAAQTLGYSNVKHFTPGITGWKSAHAKVETASAT